MIHIKVAEPTSDKWKKWCKKCNEEQQQLNETHAQGEPKGVNDRLYKEQKEHFLGFNGSFHGKCAYCETLISENHPGDVEHFRPKKGITENYKTIVYLDDEKKKPHPGYYWLTYNYKNFLPSCIDCNRYGKFNSAGRLVGKQNEFPVKNFRASKPDDETKEEPLLLNPLNVVEIKKHLTIDETGIIIPLTDEGEATCRVFGLNKREALITRRIDEYFKGKDAVNMFTLSGINENDTNCDRHQKTIEEFVAGKKPYSMAGRAGMEEEFTRQEEVGARLRTAIKKATDT